MTDGDLAVEARERRDQHGRGVTLNERHVGVAAFQPPVDRVHETRGECRERLAWSHDAEVGVHAEAELLRDLLEHLAMLAGGDHAAVEVGDPRRAVTTGAILIASGRVPMKTATVLRALTAWTTSRGPSHGRARRAGRESLARPATGTRSW